MSVIVKGAKIPSDCISCCHADVRNADVLVCRLMNKKMISDDVMTCRHADCPLVDIPSGHGRLMDADALIPMMKYATTDSEIGVLPIKIGFDAIVKVIDAQPTILDAEGEE